MAEGDDDSERTEEPTSKRIEQAVEKGQVAFSREVTSFFVFAFLCFFILVLIPYIGKMYIGGLRKYISSPEDILINKENIVEILYNAVVGIIVPFLIPMLIMLIFAFLSSFAQNGIVVSAEPLIPKLEKISLIAGFKRLFSLRSFVEFLKGLAKISVIAYIAYLLIKDYFNIIPEIPALSFMGIAKYTSSLCLKLVMYSTLFMFFVALIDFVYQKYEYIKGLRMTKQELKEEFKQSEGNPEIKAKLRQLREQKAKKRMMAAVPKADVVIRNPTHYAIALEYDQLKMNAPKVTALGQDLVALNIIKIAEDNKVPVVENRPLAKALYQSASLDEEIPFQHYKAVAEIIAYVFKMKGKA
jgi:flagellar biosynthetic protein FlhB